MISVETSLHILVLHEFRRTNLLSLVTTLDADTKKIMITGAWKVVEAPIGSLCRSRKRIIKPQHTVRHIHMPKDENRSCPCNIILFKRNIFVSFECWSSPSVWCCKEIGLCFKSCIIKIGSPLIMFISYPLVLAIWWLSCIKQYLHNKNSETVWSIFHCINYHVKVSTV